MSFDNTLQRNKYLRKAWFAAYNVKTKDKARLTNMCRIIKSRRRAPWRRRMASVRGAKLLKLVRLEKTTCRITRAFRNRKMKSKDGEANGVIDPGPLPLHTYIEGCITPPCQLPQLQDVVINIVFQARHTIRSMRTLARAFVLGAIGITYPLGAEEVTCNFLTNTYCPLLQDEVVSYTLRMYIEPTFPVGTAVTIEFRVLDDLNEVVMCIRVPIRIIQAVTEGRADNNTMLIN